MHDLSDFHRNARELLRQIGFDAPSPSTDQEVISLTVEQRFTVHLGSIDAEHWFMLADLGDFPAHRHAEQLIMALRGNQLAPQRWQALAALDADDRLCCWLRLPIRGCDISDHLAAFDALIARSEALLAEISRAPADGVRQGQWDLARGAGQQRQAATDKPTGIAAS